MSWQEWKEHNANVMPIDNSRHCSKLVDKFLRKACILFYLNVKYGKSTTFGGSFFLSRPWTSAWKIAFWWYN